MSTKMFIADAGWTLLAFAALTVYLHVLAVIGS